MSVNEHQQTEIMMLRAFDNQNDSMLDAIRNITSENCEVVTFDYLQDCVSSLESKDSGIHLSPISAESSNIDLQLHNANCVSKTTELNTIDLNLIKIHSIFLDNESRSTNLTTENIQISEAKSNLIDPESLTINSNVSVFTDLSKQTVSMNYDKLNIASTESTLANNRDNVSLEFNENNFHLCSMTDESPKNILNVFNDNCHLKETEDNKTAHIESNVLCDNNDTINFNVKPLTLNVKDEKKNNILDDKQVKTCEQCAMTFRYKRHLDRHLEGHQKNNCTYCNAKFARRKHLEVHLFRTHGERVVKYAHPCDLCSCSFPKKILLDRHRAKHNIKDNQTSVENINTPEMNINNQTIDENIEKEFKCAVCFQIFDTEQAFLTHIESHTDYSCTECNLTFSDEKEMIEHFKGVHSIVLNDIIITDNGFYFCTDCKHKFVKKEDYIRHLASVSHLGKMSATDAPIKNVFICTICSKELISQRALDQHIRRIHKGEKRFSCNMYGCTFQCSRRSDLDRHRHLHIEERNVICEHCGKSFTSVSILNDHVLYVHNKERQFVCEECGKAFKRNSLLKRHKLSHQQVRPFACMQCSTAFKRSHHLTRHMESCHRITLEKKKKVVKLMKTETGNLVPVPEKPKKLRSKKTKIKKTPEITIGLDKNLTSSPTDLDLLSTIVNSEAQTQTLENSDDNFKSSKLSSELLNLLQPENNQQVLSLVDVTSGQIVTVEVMSPESLPVNDFVNQTESNYELLSLTNYQDLEFNTGILNADQHYYNSGYTDSTLENVETGFLLDSNTSKMDTIDNYLTQPFSPFLNL